MTPIFAAQTEHPSVVEVLFFQIAGHYQQAIRTRNSPSLQDA
jgi:hypothetical protein